MSDHNRYMLRIHGWVDYLRERPTGRDDARNRRGFARLVFLGDPGQLDSGDLANFAPRPRREDWRI